MKTMNAIDITFAIARPWKQSRTSAISATRFAAIVAPPINRATSNRVKLCDSAQAAFGDRIKPQRPEQHRAPPITIRHRPVDELRDAEPRQEPR